MRELPVEFQNIISVRGAICARTFISFEARNRQTNAIERLGIWTGGDAEVFTVEGVTQTYFGGSCVVDLGEMENEVGTNVKTYTVKLASLTPVITALMRQYNPKGARIKIHTALYDPATGLRDTPFVRRFNGWVDKAPIKTPPKNSKEAGSVSMTCVSISRNTTRTVPSRKSNENQKLRNPNDQFFSYVSVSGSVQTPWGAERVVSKEE